MILPAGDSAFWSHAAAGELRVQACAGCGRRRMPPRPMCPWCQGLDDRWDLMAGTATVWSFAVPHPPLLEPYAARAPYPVLVVTLDDDPTIRLVGDCPADVRAEDVAIGAAVEVVFERVADDVVLPRWRPVLR